MQALGALRRRALETNPGSVGGAGVADVCVQPEGALPKPCRLQVVDTRGDASGYRQPVRCIVQSCWGSPCEDVLKLLSSRAFLAPLRPTTPMTLTGCRKREGRAVKCVRNVRPIIGDIEFRQGVATRATRR